MPRITVSDLQRRGAEIFDELEATGKPVVIFRKALPVAILRPFDDADMELLKAQGKGKEAKHGKR